MQIKSMLRMWEQRLDALLTGIYHRIHARQRAAQPSYEAFVLREKLEEKERDIKYLQFQLIKVRVDNTELQLRRNELAALFEDVIRKTNDQLRQGLRLHVQSTEDGTAWETVTEHCCLGGCDLGIYTFPTERDALLFAALLDAAGYQPPLNNACSECYAEYMKDCI